MAVAFGDQRRRLDAIELLVGEITSTQIDWNSDSIPLAIRNALEVRYRDSSSKFDSFYVVQLLFKGRRKMMSSLWLLVAQKVDFEIIRRRMVVVILQGITTIY